MIATHQPPIYEVQHDFALSSGLRSSEVIWDSLAPDESDILRQKIATLLPDTTDQNVREQMRNALFENVWLQRKYTNGTLLSSIVHVMVTQEKNENAAKQSTAYTLHPVFRTRKCINFNNSAGCCMIFIDQYARVYQDWHQFLVENVFPKGTMVAPANGVYTFNNNDEVNLECHPTPAALKKARLLNAADAVVALGSLIVTVPVVAAPVIIAATVASVAYTTVRSAMLLEDRRQHSQSIALTDRVARNSWLGLGFGVFGLGATGVTKLTSAAVAGQEISLAVRGINSVAIALSGTGIVNGVFDIYMKINDNENVNHLDLLQLASSLLVFTHSINNLSIASKVATSGGRGSSMRSELRNQMKQIFDRISGDTAQKLGGCKGGGDIIRALNDIPYGDMLMNLHTINSHLIGEGRGIVNALASSLITATMHASSAPAFNLLYLAEEFGNNFVQHIANPNSLLEVLGSMAHYLCEKSVRLLMQLAQIFINESEEAIVRLLNQSLSTELVLYKILMHCVRKYSNFSYIFLESKTTEILSELNIYFHSLNPVNLNESRNCHICSGYYFVCDL